MLTREMLLAWCPNARESYLSVLTDPEWGGNMMAVHEIIKTPNRLMYFLANGAHETGGLTVEAESLRYKTTTRLRAVWPSRFGKMSDRALKKFITSADNPEGDKNLAMAVYNGKRPDGSDRMGNRPGTMDGYLYRGRGFLQVTGRYAYEKYGKLLGYDFEAQPELLDHMGVMFAMACMEVWYEGLNEIADEGDFNGYCAKLNTGSRARVKGCVGLTDRHRWLRIINAYFAKRPHFLDQLPAALIEPPEEPEADIVPGAEVAWADALDDDDDEAFSVPTMMA